MSRAVLVIQQWLETAGEDGKQRTQAELARLVGGALGKPFTQTSISHISRGQQLPRADVIAAFRIVLGIEPEWWLPDTPSSSERLDDADATGPRKTQSGSMPAVDVKPTGS